MLGSTPTVIKLSGPLIREFGREHTRFLDTGSVQEAFSALRNTLPGFKEAIARLRALGMRFAIFRNRKNVGEDAFAGSGAREIRIVPVIAGSKRAGLLQTIVGGANGRQYLDWTYYLSDRRGADVGRCCSDAQPQARA